MRQRLPAEWEPHERCLMAWPVRAELWGEWLGDAKRDYATIANAIARFEPVLMLAPSGAVAEARELCGDGVEVIEFELDDSWTRDTGPLIVRSETGERVGVDFEFNGWGGKYVPYDLDATLAARVLELLEIPRQAVSCVLEGGAITGDGEGTLITTESAVLNDNRNPALSAADVSSMLASHLGAHKVIWLGTGLLEDRDTDGHVDNICHFIASGHVLVQTEPDPDKPNHARLKANADQLRATTDAAGRTLEVTELPYLPYLPDELPTVAPYLNFYLADGAVIVPVIGHADDDAALALIAAALPERAVVAVPGATLARGGGGVHCITMQVPAR